MFLDMKSEKKLPREDKGLKADLSKRKSIIMEMIMILKIIIMI